MSIAISSAAPNHFWRTLRQNGFTGLRDARIQCLVITNQTPQTKDFRSFLQQELIRRCDRNPNYSLRSFAKTLAISSSALSAILNGKRPLTEKTTLRLGAALGLAGESIREFRQAARPGAGAESADVQQLTFDAFAVVSEWYHFAILELIRTKSFRPDPAYVARALGLTRSQVNAAVERLQRTGLLEIRADGTWADRSSEGRLTAIHGDLTSAAAKLLQKKILELGMEAINEVSPDLRSNTAITVAVSAKDLPEAKKRIQKFRRDLANFFEKTKEPEHVYHLAVALYPLTKFET
ncbi:MAG: TIGR02147 family protein [Proteobacteria bacterium]|nr:MAG: TIGR02147 family protein [Pseudomonadota bacterium]